MKRDPYFKFVALVVLSAVVLAFSGIGDTVVPDTVPLARATPFDASATYTASVEPAAPAVTNAPANETPVVKHPRRPRASKPVS